MTHEGGIFNLWGGVCFFNLQSSSLNVSLLNVFVFAIYNYVLILVLYCYLQILTEMRKHMILDGAWGDFVAQ